jgi:diaminopimelate decarboxylase
MKHLLPLSASFDPEKSFSLAKHDLAGLARQYGTPLYVYDGATLRALYEQLRSLLGEHYPGPSEITYAAKAYLSLGFARKLAGLGGLGIDVVSLGELRVAQKAGFPARAVHLHGNNKSEAELCAALEWGAQAMVVDSLDELAFLDRICERLGKPARIWFRVTPGVNVHTHKAVQTAHHASKFGLPVADGQAAEGIRRARSSRWLKLVGLHTHLGSQIFEAEPYHEAVRALCQLAASAGFEPEELSPGGGWGVPYTLEDDAVDPSAWIRSAGQTLQAEAQKYGWRLPKLIVEPGRWLTARSAVAVYTVGSVKQAGDGTRMVAVDGGMADNPRPALYASRYTALLLPGDDAGPSGTVRDWTPRPAAVVGRYCESGDQLIENVALPEARRGDLLVIPVAGAYQLSMASNYNLTSRPAVLWVEEGGVEVLQPREDITVSGWWVD